MLTALTTNARVADAVWEAESVTLAVNEKDPVADGVPLRSPVALNVTPAGSVPVVMLHL